MVHLENNLYMLSLIIIDFEVFKYDTLFGAIIINGNDEQIYQTWDLLDIKKFFVKHQNDIWLTWNGLGYDNHILNAIMHDENVYTVSKKCIATHNYIPSTSLNFINYDIMRQRKGGHLSLKLTELIAGENIHTTDVNFDIDRPLTNEEKKLEEDYNKDDLIRTRKNFTLFKNDFELRIDLSTEFNLPLQDILNITGTQLGAAVLGVKKNFSLPYKPVKPIWYDCLKVNNELVKDWYLNEKFKNNETLNIKICDEEVTIKSGGAHSAIKKYHADKFIYLDVSGFYNLLQIIYDLFPRSVPPEGKKKYAKMYYDQLKMKKTNPIKRAGYKTVLLSCWGGAGNERTDFYDPWMANLIPVTGEVFLIDLLEKLDGLVRLIQANTDGICINPYNWNDYDKIIEIVTEWETRTGFTIKKEIKYNLWQRDVNCYICTDDKGEIEFHGDDFKNYDISETAFAKEQLFNCREAPIIAKGLVEFLINGQMPEQTIVDNKSDLRWFQYVCKVSTYKYLTLDTTIYTKNANNKLIAGNTSSEEIPSLSRAFAKKPIYNDDNTISLSTVRKHKENKSDKIASLPPSVFIYNYDILNSTDELLNNIDFNYYIDRIYEKINKFIQGEK